MTTVSVWQATYCFDNIICEWERFHSLSQKSMPAPRQSGISLEESGTPNKQKTGCSTVVEIMGDVEQAVAGNVVYENHTQNFIQPAASRAQVLLDEHQFEKLTSMETSAQARVALLMLLEQHNISSKQLARSGTTS
ncbi:hypothetical protein FNU76_00005 [Chitinimonas arctica]|uniref:Uncharacterized protein n=1 Tax=Chitinimonas arctica TaxID=2594795 RepID=A0A516S9L1_9NEIS|nr:hypothetical protein [Chitinimonas arctica]QDQ24851.1 hypothetical protein FNU76_00005 [Chitinimonas arctica]